jgi:hypothetical protein
MSRSSWCRRCHCCRRLRRRSAPRSRCPLLRSSGCSFEVPCWVPFGSAPRAIVRSTLAGPSRGPCRPRPNGWASTACRRYGPEAGDPAVHQVLRTDRLPSPISAATSGPEVGPSVAPRKWWSPRSDSNRRPAVDKGARQPAEPAAEAGISPGFSGRPCRQGVGDARWAARPFRRSTLVAEWTALRTLNGVLLGRAPWRPSLRLRRRGGTLARRRWCHLRFGRRAPGFTRPAAPSARSPCQRHRRAGPDRRSAGRASPAGCSPRMAGRTPSQ